MFSPLAPDSHMASEAWLSTVFNSMEHNDIPESRGMDFIHAGLIALGMTLQAANDE